MVLLWRCVCVRFMCIWYFSCVDRMQRPVSFTSVFNGHSHSFSHSLLIITFHFTCATPTKMKSTRRQWCCCDNSWNEIASFELFVCSCHLLSFRMHSVVLCATVAAVRLANCIKGIVLFLINKMNLCYCIAATMTMTSSTTMVAPVIDSPHQNCIR